MSLVIVQPIMPVQATTVTVAAVPAATTANAIALYDYDAKAEGEISLRNGDELVIVVPDSGGWVKVRNLISQATGLVPANYIKTTEASDGAGNAAVAANVAAIPPLVKAVSASSVLSSAKQGMVFWSQLMECISLIRGANSQGIVRL